MNDTQRDNIAKHFKNTELVLLRIKRNLKLLNFTDSETEELLKEIILSTSCINKQAN